MDLPRDTEASKGGNTIDIIQVIEEIESLASSATRVPGFRKRVMVDSDRLDVVSEALRTSIPADIQEAREILTQKESIINQAHLEARRVKESAEQEAAAVTVAARKEQAMRVDETEIVKEAQSLAEDTNQRALQEAQEIAQDAQRRAIQIIDEADTAAVTRREGADQYARETLFDLEERLSSQLSQVRRGIDALGLDVEAKIPA